MKALRESILNNLEYKNVNFNSIAGCEIAAIALPKSLPQDLPEMSKLADHYLENCLTKRSENQIWGFNSHLRMFAKFEMNWIKIKSVENTHSYA